MEIRRTGEINGVGQFTADIDEDELNLLLEAVNVVFITVGGTVGLTELKADLVKGLGESK